VGALSALQGNGRRFGGLPDLSICPNCVSEEKVLGELEGFDPVCVSL
jgi:hypothetical protein